METSTNLFKPIASPRTTGCNYRNHKAKPVPVSAYSAKALRYIKTRANILIKDDFVYVLQMS